MEILESASGGLTRLNPHMSSIPDMSHLSAIPDMCSVVDLQPTRTTHITRTITRKGAARYCGSARVQALYRKSRAQEREQERAMYESERACEVTMDEIAHTYERWCVKLPAPARVPVMPTEEEMAHIERCMDMTARKDAEESVRHGRGTVRVKRNRARV